MSDIPPDAKAIFLEAIDQKSPEDLLRYLDEACGDNAEVRSRIEELLQAHQDAGNFLGGSPSANTTVDQPITEKAGTVIGPYKLLQKIGEGGMGVVYMADQTKPVERRVALKIIKPGMDTRQVVARFEAERQALAMMDHPNISKVFDAGTTDSGRPYFVMELVKGVPITQYADENHLTPRQRLELFIPVCQAVQHAHQKAIIHRDIKPSNVLVCLYDGKPVPKVIDFGLAKAISRRLTEKTMFTQFGQIVGTLEYMSPEQAEFSQLDLDTRSDIYSLGVLLYELLTGKTPLDRERLRSAAFEEMLRIIREEEPPRPSVRISSLGDRLPSVAAQRKLEPKKLSSLVRGELDWIVMKALEKDRTRRYETATTFSADVERYLSDEPVQACPPSVVYRFRKFVRRYRVPVMVTVMLLAVLVVGGVGATTGWIEAAGLNTVLIEKRDELEREVHTRREAQARAEEAQSQAEAARKKVEEESVRRRWLLYTADMRLANQAHKSGNLGRLEALLRRHVPVGSEEDLRGFEWFCLWRHWKRESDSDPLLPSSSNVFLTWLALSSDGSRLVVGGPYGHAAMTLIDMNTREELDSFGVGPTRWEGVGLAISTDGETVVYSSSKQDKEAASEDRKDGSVVVRDVETGKERLINTVGTVALSPDLRTLAIGHPDGTIWLWDLDTWKRTATLEGHTEQVFALAFSPDGNNLASVGDDRTVRVWNVTTGEPVWVGEGNSGGIFSVAYSPTGRFVATGSRDKIVAIWDAVTGKRLQTLGGAHDEVRVVAISRDEKFLAAACRGGTIRLWRLPDFSEHEIISGLSSTYGLAFLPDGNLVFRGPNGHLVVRNVQTTRQGVLSTSVPLGKVRRIAFSADSSILSAINSADPRRVCLWALTQDGANELDPLVLESDATALAVSCQNRLAVGDSASATVYLFDLPSRTPIPPLTVPDMAGTALAAFSPTGKRLAIGCKNGRVIVWDMKTRQVIMDQRAHRWGIRGLRFCGDDSTLLTGSLDPSAKLWSVEQGTLLHSFGKHPASIQAIDATDDGNILATGTFIPDSSIRLFHRASQEPIKILRGHTDAVRGVAIFRDGKTLASAGGDRTVRLWDVASQEERFSFDGGTCIFECMELSPDERTLAAGGRDGTIRLYRAASLEEVEAEPGWSRVAEHP